MNFEIRGNQFVKDGKPIKLISVLISRMLFLTLTDIRLR